MHQHGGALNTLKPLCSLRRGGWLLHWTQWFGTTYPPDPPFDDGLGGEHAFANSRQLHWF
jgi:hypothetical protein